MMTLDSVSIKTSAAPTIESTRLSQHVFANPSDFLQTIENNFSKIAQTDPTFISKADLELYATTGKDEKTKAAARIAAEHYDELKSMHFSDDLLPLVDSGVKGNHKVLNYDEIEMDKKLYEGKMTSTTITRELRDGLFFGVVGAAGAVGGVAGVLLNNPYIAIGAPVVAAPMCYMLGKDMYNAPGAIRALSANSQRTFSSWGEFKA